MAQAANTAEAKSWGYRKLFSLLKRMTDSERKAFEKGDEKKLWRQIDAEKYPEDFEYFAGETLGTKKKKEESPTTAGPPQYKNVLVTVEGSGKAPLRDKPPKEHTERGYQFRGRFRAKNNELPKAGTDFHVLTKAKVNQYFQKYEDGKVRFIFVLPAGNSWLNARARESGPKPAVKSQARKAKNAQKKKKKRQQRRQKQQQPSAGTASGDAKMAPPRAAEKGAGRSSLSALDADTPRERLIEHAVYMKKKAEDAKDRVVASDWKNIKQIIENHVPRDRYDPSRPISKYLPREALNILRMYKDDTLQNLLNKRQ